MNLPAFGLLLLPLGCTLQLLPLLLGCIDPLRLALSRAGAGLVDRCGALAAEPILVSTAIAAESRFLCTHGLMLLTLGPLGA